MRLFLLVDELSSICRNVLHTLLNFLTLVAKLNQTIMKLSTVILSFCFCLLTSLSVNAQSAEEIIATYLETVGGEEAISNINTMTLVANSKFQGMEIPIKMYQKAPNMQRMDMIFQGKEITQMCYNGEVGWSTNFMTQEAELWETEDSENMKHQMDFPESFLNYADKGYSISLEEEKNVDGTDCFKIKLTKNPISINGEEVENYSYYYFDKETFVPIMQEEFMHKGQMAGATTEMYFSDYQEVNGVYHPHAMSQKVNGQAMFDMVISEILINEEIDDSLFAAPEISATTDDEPETKPSLLEEADQQAQEVINQMENPEAKEMEKSSGGDPGKG